MFCAIVLKFQDYCRDFITKLNAIAKSKLSKVHVDYIRYIITMFEQNILCAPNLFIVLCQFYRY